MTEPRTDRPDLPLDDRDEPLTGLDLPGDGRGDPQEAPSDIPGPEDGDDLDTLIAKDIDDLDPGAGE